MTRKERFLEQMQERRKHGKDTLEYEWRTKAARKLYWMLRGVPVSEWTD